MPLILIASVLCFGGWFALGSGGLWDMYSLRQRYQRQQKQISELKARRDYLQQRLASLKDKDELALEQAARDFGLVAKGETVYEIKVEPEKK
jgi:cell division protein FtsB